MGNEGFLSPVLSYRTAGRNWSPGIPRGRTDQKESFNAKAESPIFAKKSKGWSLIKGTNDRFGMDDMSSVWCKDLDSWNTPEF